MFDFLKQKDRTPPALPQGNGAPPLFHRRAGAGVGFRYRARYAAQTLELTGWVENEDDGSVTLEVQGDPDQFMRLFAMIQKKRLHPDHRHPPEGSAARPVGARLLGAGVLIEIFRFFVKMCLSARVCAAIKAPVGLLSGRAVCVSRWKGFTLTSPQGASNTNIRNNFPLKMPRANAEGILIGKLKRKTKKR